jgi:glyoxylase-like metal-dependent hydrolase (beta-lactamase superfamily II)
MRIERIKCGNGNCFLIYGNGGSILVDTSRTQYREDILARCRDADVRLILLTHGHIDHVQNAAFLSAELASPIALHEADLPLLKDNFAEPMSAHRLLGRVVLSLSEKSFKEDGILQFEPSIFLHDGDSLSAYGINGQVIALPGHTKGSVGVVVGKDDVFVGDALMNFIRPQKSLLYGDWQQVEQSARRIGNLGNMTVHFGHGKSAQNRKW